MSGTARPPALPVTALRSTTLREGAFHALREAILSGQLPPGARLLESELAATLGVSRNPVREALARLESHGLVLSIPNQGARVVQPSRAQVQDALLVRAQLELLAVRLALRKGKAEAFGPLAPIVRDMVEAAEAAASDAGAYGRMNLLDVSFHEVLVSCAESDSLEHTWTVAAPLDLIFAFDISALLENGSQGAQLVEDARKHQHLLDELLSGNAQRAENALKQHFTAPARSGMISLDAASIEILGW